MHIKNPDLSKQLEKQLERNPAAVTVQTPSKVEEASEEYYEEESEYSQ